MTLRGELSLDEVNDLLRRLGPRAKSTRDPGDARKGCQTLLAIVERAVADLTARADEHDQRAAGDEARRAAERAFDTSLQVVKLDRFKGVCKRSVKRLIVTLQKLRRWGVGEKRHAAASAQGLGPANRHRRAVPSKRDL